MYDVIVVGAGVAGSYIASKLDADVLVLEKDKDIVLKDSGIVSHECFEYFNEKALIQNDIKQMQFISPSGLEFVLSADEPFAHILKRRLFSLHLRKLARKNSKISYETVRKINYLHNSVEVHTDSSVYECKLLVGSDGAHSLVRKFMGINDPLMFTGIFSRAKLPIESNKIKIYPNKYFSPDFFAWIISQSSEYGIITSIRPYEYFQYFKNKLHLPEGDIYSSSVPIGFTKSYANRALLVGDACGQTKPLTGGGIMFSLIAADHAIKVINEACEKKRFDEEFLADYESLWKEDFSSEIRKQLLARKIYRKLTNQDIDKLFRDFGPFIEKIEEFDYDRLSGIWRKMPKGKLIKFIISNIWRII
ncbi:MAG: NAD(P)/FAD-dependent oxidoreductase [Candidatus Aenigmarchaeota archaeon]|nr:NAD(P)/FAD-dependent oxidoreductase [Candidatus Aenigmarchaeota archaeon]